MRLVHLSSFLTLVLLVFATLAWAAPTSDVILDSTKPSPQDKDASSEAFRHVKPSESWKGSTNFTLGYFMGVMNTDKENETTPTVGLQRTQYNREPTAQEFGIALSQKKVIALDWGYKWLVADGDMADPFYKLALAGLYDPKDSIGNVINYKRYYARGSIGFDNLFGFRKRIKLEMIVGAGSPGMHALAQVSYAFPD